MKERSYSLNKFSLLKDIIHTIFSRIETMVIFRYFLVIIAYIVLTILLTYPVAFTIGTDIPGSLAIGTYMPPGVIEGGDGFQWLNALWYTNFALFHPEITTLAYNNMIFYPNGIPVSPSPSAFNQLAAIILLPFCQIQTIYSLLWLLSFILAAFGTYLLVRYLTKNDAAAFISGLIFAFIPFHFVHGTGHLGATSIEWIPFCALFLMKMFRDGGVKNSILAGIFFILIAMSELQYMIFMGIFVALLFLYEHITVIQTNHGFSLESHKQILIRYLIFGIVAFSVILPLTASDINVATSENNFLKPDTTDVVSYSADAFSFFLPSVQHPLFGKLVYLTYRSFTGNYAENTTYIGYSVLILSVFALLLLRKDRMVRFWGSVAVIFSLFSLGPVLHIAGKIVFSRFEVSIPLPYILLDYIVPFLQNSRTPGRLYILAALGFAVLAGYGYNELIKRYDAKKILITFLILTLIIFEYLAIPLPITPVDRPVFYKTIGKDPGQSALLEIPLTNYYAAGTKIIYYQTIHEKPIVGGHYSRPSGSSRDFELNTPFIRELTFMQPVENDIFLQNDSEIGNSILTYYNIRYVILHTNFLEPGQTANLTRMLDMTLGHPIQYSDDQMIVYERKNENPKLFFKIIDGFYAVENGSGTPTRWMTNNSNVMIYSTDNRMATISLRSASFNTPRTLVISTPDKYETRIPIGTGFTPVTVPINLSAGENIIRFNVP